MLLNILSKTIWTNQYPLNSWFGVSLSSSTFTWGGARQLSNPQKPFVRFNSSLSVLPIIFSFGNFELGVILLDWSPFCAFVCSMISLQVISLQVNYKTSNWRVLIINSVWGLHHPMFLAKSSQWILTDRWVSWKSRPIESFQQL